MGACTPAGRDGNGNGKYGLLSLTCAQDHGDTKSIMSCHVPTHRRGGGGGMQAYNGHFQLHMHSWLLDGIANCLICLAVVNHDDSCFKCQNLS